MSFPGRREAPNILHRGKMLAPHFKDEIASLQNWPFLASFWPFLEQFFHYDSYLWANQLYFAKKIVPRCLFLAAGRLQTFFIPLLKGPHRLLNWQNPSHKSQLSMAINWQIDKSKWQESVECGNQLGSSPSCQVESNLSRLNFWSLAHLLLMLVVGVSQVLFIIISSNVSSFAFNLLNSS